MFEIETARSRYGYGTTRARMYRDVAIPESTSNLMIWDFFLGLLLCGTHTNYRTRLYSTAPKGFISLPDFRSLMRNFMSEWAGKCTRCWIIPNLTQRTSRLQPCFNCAGIVRSTTPPSMLKTDPLYSVNVGFLAVPVSNSLARSLNALVI